MPDNSLENNRQIVRILAGEPDLPVFPLHEFGLACLKTVEEKMARANTQVRSGDDG